MDVEVEDCQILFGTCRWINHPFTRLRVSADFAVAMVTVALEAEDGCVPGGAVVGKEVRSGGICCYCHIGLVQWSGGNAVICFCMPARTEGETHSIVGEGVLYRWRRRRRKGELVQIVRKCN